MENVFVKELKAEAVSIIMGEPDPSCPYCKGIGKIHDIICSCSCQFGKIEDVTLLVAIEKKNDGSIDLDFEEKRERRIE